MEWNTNCLEQWLKALDQEYTASLKQTFPRLCCCWLCSKHGEEHDIWGLPEAHGVQGLLCVWPKPHVCVPGHEPTSLPLLHLLITQHLPDRRPARGQEPPGCLRQVRPCSHCSRFVLFYGVPVVWSGLWLILPNWEDKNNQTKLSCIVLGGSTLYIMCDRFHIAQANYFVCNINKSVLAGIERRFNLLWHIFHCLHEIKCHMQ